jgi:hypothetical protein
MDKNLKDTTYFISFCIEQYMNAKGINEDEVIATFSEYGVFDYLKDYFEVLHTPNANDKVYAAFALYEGGIIDKQNLISELKAYKLVDQYLFHTDKALKAIKFIEAKQVTL